MEDHGVDLAVFIALCICTLLSIAFDVIHMPKSLTVALVLAVACAKALFVMTFFALLLAGAVIGWSDPFVHAMAVGVVLALTAGPVSVGSVVSVGASFSDPDVRDTHTAGAVA